MNAGVHARVFGIIDDTISMTNFALDLRTSGHMPIFRRCSEQEIESRLVIRTGCPSEDAVRCKARIMRLRERSLGDFFCQQSRIKI